MKKQEFSAGPSTSTPAPSPLPMFKPRLRAQKATPVGNYAIQFDYSDGHSTGIYSYDYLRTMCPCEDCAREFRSPGHDLDSSINS
jgi:hypothetical protein